MGEEATLNEHRDHVRVAVRVAGHRLERDLGFHEEPVNPVELSPGRAQRAGRGSALSYRGAGRRRSSLKVLTSPSVMVPDEVRSSSSSAGTTGSPSSQAWAPKPCGPVVPITRSRRRPCAASHVCSTMAFTRHVSPSRRSTARTARTEAAGRRGGGGGERGGGSA